jgi:hypothetical protein
MDKIWLVLYITGTVTGVWGPMDYTNVELCNQDAVGFNYMAVTALDTADIDKPTFQCETSEKAPLIGTQLKLGVPVHPKGTIVIPDSSQRN